MKVEFDGNKMSAEMNDTPSVQAVHLPDIGMTTDSCLVLGVISIVIAFVALALRCAVFAFRYFIIELYAILPVMASVPLYMCCTVLCIAALIAGAFSVFLFIKHDGKDKNLGAVICSGISGVISIIVMINSIICISALWLWI